MGHSVLAERQILGLRESDLLGQHCPVLRPVGAGFALGWWGSHL